MSRSHSRHSNLRPLDVIAHLEMPRSAYSHLPTHVCVSLCLYLVIETVFLILYTFCSRKYTSVLLPFRTAVGVALRCGWLWSGGWREGGDAAVVCTQQQAETHTQHQRQQQVVLPVRHLGDRPSIMSWIKLWPCPDVLGRQNNTVKEMFRNNHCGSCLQFGLGCWWLAISQQPRSDWRQLPQPYTFN